MGAAAVFSGVGAERRRAGKDVLQLPFRASVSPRICSGCVLTEQARVELYCIAG